MLLIHRAMTDKLAVRPETSHWIFDQCVFFVAGWDGMSDGEAAEASYAPAGSPHVYVLEVAGDEADLVVSRGRLVLDDVAQSEIADRWGADADADDILTGNQEVEESIEDGGWHIQRIRAQLARRMGFLAVADRDEQGRVLIVDFSGRTDELNARWRYLGHRAELSA